MSSASPLPSAERAGNASKSLELRRIAQKVEDDPGNSERATRFPTRASLRLHSLQDRFTRAAERSPATTWKSDCLKRGSGQEELTTFLRLHVPQEECVYRDLSL